MKKQRTPKSTRKPPETLAERGAIDDWINRVMPDLHPLVKRIDELIRRAVPELQYAIKWGKVYYGVPERGWIIELVAYDVSVNIVFLAGAEFPGSQPPLGTGERSRYIKLRTLEEVNQPQVFTWIQQAGETRGWM
ncbi:DUF1801 domain-containing protein [Spirochaeta lutea]|uniref:YdhG-like domain-containing protein n=1 Tax=Spirochaeta lutea TaxID=1480694 RepID=A0A098QTJ4_9SPIO|nr:DUF1801 domain-containing protein [Spirochaeta lutea]KGE70846.1 hypothetical protein DC28_15345 [Spirochaeta lutea]